MQVLVVDDHPLIQEALQHLLRQLCSEVQVLSAVTAEEGLELVTAHPDARLLLLDLNLPGADGLALLSEVRHAFPTLPVVVLSASDRREHVLRAMDLGARGFIPKRASTPIMLHALRLVLSGGTYLPPEVFTMRDSPTAQESPPAAPIAPRDVGLTARQAEVFALVLQGKSNKLICRELGLAEGTVKIHVAAILRALNVNSRTQAVIAANRLGLRLDHYTPGWTPPPSIARAGARADA